MRFVVQSDDVKIQRKFIGLYDGQEKAEFTEVWFAFKKSIEACGVRFGGPKIKNRRTAKIEWIELAPEKMIIYVLNICRLLVIMFKEYVCSISIE